jgi:hypothetical protein
MGGVHKGAFHSTYQVISILLLARFGRFDAMPFGFKFASDSNKTSQAQLLSGGAVLPTSHNIDVFGDGWQLF